VGRNNMALSGWGMRALQQAFMTAA
jgi:hypothetical protein